MAGHGWRWEAKATACSRDANGDGLTDPLDAGYVLRRLGCDAGEGDPDCAMADQNGDADLDLVVPNADEEAISVRFNRTVPIP